MKVILAIMLLSSVCSAQTWFKVANGGDTITASNGAVLRYGSLASTYACDSAPHKAGDASAEAWSPTLTLTAATTITDVSIFGSDPANCVVKEIDVQETAVAQVVTVNGTTVTIPALPAVTNACSSSNTSCTNATSSDAAFIITPAGNVSLNPTETSTLKTAIQALQTAQAQTVAAQAALQVVQQSIAVNHGASATGPYQINTDFNTTIEQVPPVPVLTAQ